MFSSNYNVSLTTGSSNNEQQQQIKITQIENRIYANQNESFYEYMVNNIENNPPSNWGDVYACDGCPAGSGNLGATVYIENDGIGHAYIEVNGSVFSYGRYDGSYSPSSGAYGPVGRGVMLKKDHAYATKRMEKYPTSVYQFPNANANAIYNYLNKIYNSGTPTNGKQGGMVINTYVLLGQNCTSTTCLALKVGGVSIPIIQIPSEFNKYMSDPNFYNTNNNWLLK